MHHSMCFWCVLVLCAAVTAEVDFSTLKSPCPEMFSYKQSNGQWLGSLQLDRNMQNERQAEVKVGLSIPASLNGNFGKLELVNDLLGIPEDIHKFRPIKYRILFPYQDPLPTLTFVKLNGVDICNGPPAKRYPGGSLASVTLHHSMLLPQYNPPQPAPIPSEYLNNNEPLIGAIAPNGKPIRGWTQNVKTQTITNTTTIVTTQHHTKK